MTDKEWVRGVLEISGFLADIEGIHKELKALRQIQEKPKADRPLLSQAQVAKRLGVRRELIVALVNSGKLPTVKVGKRERITPEAIDRLIESGSLSPEKRGRPRKANAKPKAGGSMPIFPLSPVGKSVGKK